MTVTEIRGHLAANKAARLAIAVSEFNQHITSKLLAGALEQIAALQLEFAPVVVHVPGAVELPFAAQQLAERKQFDAIICLGAVVRGETTHYDYVCEQASQGCQRVMLDHQLPVIFGVLTVENDAQGLARVGGAHGHKGKEAVDGAMLMISVSQQITALA